MPSDTEVFPMDEQIIRQPVEDVWHHHCAALEEALDETIRALQNLLRLDEYHRHGHEASHLEETLGPMGSSSLNLDSLSEVLGKSSSRVMPEQRLERIHKLLERLESLRASCATSPDDYPSTDIEEEESVIHEKAEAHLNRVAEIFRNLRIAQLEIRSKYHPPSHDPIFENFNWRLLSPNELRMCPPFLIVAHLGSHSGRLLRKIMSLLESRKPIKIAILRNSLRKAYSPTSDPSVPATLAVETLPLAMRGVYFLQTCLAVPDFSKRLFEALTSPRPTLISLLGQKAGEDVVALRLRAERALRSRAFPAVVYDPDRARGFVSCFDLAGNPRSADGYTFAHFAAGEEEFATEFSLPPADLSADDFIPLGNYLELTRHQRIGKYPCIEIENEKGDKQTRLVSNALVTQSSDQLHLWKTLQEIAGVDNPHVKDTRESLEAAFGAQQKELIDTMQHDMEARQAQLQQAAVAAAVQKLVARLTGVEASSISLENLMAMAAPPPPEQTANPGKENDAGIHTTPQ